MSSESAAPASMRSADTGGVVAELAMDTDSDTAMLPAAQVARKVIANASMTLVVSDTETMVDQIEALLDQVGGYVSDANLYKSSYGDAELLRGSLTVRVPAEHLNTVMEQLSQIAVDVRSENLTREDVTDQFSDIEAQLRNLRNTETELQALLSEVRERPNSTPQDIMAVYDNLTVIRGQIEQLQGRQNMLDNLVGLSTLTLELIPDAINQPLVDAGWRPAVVVRDATRALVNTLEALGSAVIWFVVYLLPILILVAIPVVFLIWLLRKGARRLSRSRS
ncbi:MAG: DUF4349 domain-containing protein [Caldilineaceae bacterium]|nr:DUF4349 domain-containing protein [Caldilineaceae bacterium]